jgi:hypothetical protein
MNERGVPAGISGSCFLALGALGGTATTTQVRVWLGQNGERLATEQVRPALRWLTQRQQPLAELAQKGAAGYGKPGLWRITEYGRAVLADGDTPAMAAG